MGLQRQKRRATSISAAAALSATLLGWGGVCAWADGGYAGQDIESQTDNSAGSATDHTVLGLELVDAPLIQAINLIQQKTGIQVAVVGSGTNKFGTVTVSLKKLPVDEALRLVAKSADADIWKENGVYYIGPKGSAPKPAQPAPQLADTVDLLPAPREYRIEKIHLKWTSPAAMLRRLGIERKGEIDILESLRIKDIQYLIGAGSDSTQTYNTENGNRPTFVGPYGTITQVPPPAPIGNYGTTSSTGAPIQNGAATGTQNTPSVNGTGSTEDQGAHRDDGTSDEFGRGQGFGGPGFGGGGFGQGGPGFGGGGFGQGPGAPGGQNPGAPGGQAGGNAASLLPPGLTGQDITALDADQSLLLRYQTAQQLRQFRQLIDLLDVKPRQILIHGQFVTVSQNDASAFGINWNFAKVNLVAGANLGYSTTNTAFVQYAAGNLQTQLSWILTTGRGKVLTSPTASTLNGIPAVFVNNQTVPIIIQNPVIGQNGTVVVSTTVQAVQVTVFLAITPYINGDDSITLVGNLVSTDITGSITNPAGGTLPILQAQQARVTRIIRNGDTMVISGLVRKRDTLNTQKVPLLGDLPLIGTLFRSSSVTTDDSELLVFLTPEIIADRPTASAGPALGGNAAGGGAGNADQGGAGGPGVLP